MKNILAISTLAIFAAGAAVAGGVAPAVVEPAPYVAPASIATDWSGFYVGGLAGIQNGDFVTAPGTPAEATYAVDSTSYGGFVGYNFQQGNIVYGAEIAAQMGSGTFGGISVDQDYMVDARARIGYAFDSVMVYAAGGYSTAQFTSPASTFTASGFNVGAGVELALSDNFFIGGEYIYRNMNGSSLGTDYDYNTHGVQVRAGFRF